MHVTNTPFSSYFRLTSRRPVTTNTKTRQIIVNWVSVCDYKPNTSLTCKEIIQPHKTFEQCSSGNVQSLNQTKTSKTEISKIDNDKWNTMPVIGIPSDGPSGSNNNNKMCYVQSNHFTNLFGPFEANKSRQHDCHD